MPADQWEYASILVPSIEEENEALERLNAQGRQGWEIFQFCGNGATTRVWMRRRITDT